MLKELHIQNFKSHQETVLILRGITILCGQNGMGKSSVIQSLLLLKQTYDNNHLDKILDLNKPLCYIGLAKDALYQNAEKEIISFNTLEDSFEGSWSYDASNLKSDYLKLLSTPIDKDGLNSSFLTAPFHFLSASRLGSTENYLSNGYAVEIGKQLSLERGKGELTAQFLYHYQKQVVIEALKHPLEPDGSLLEQVTAWEREISKGVNVVPVKVGNDYEIKFSFNTPNGKTDEFNAENVGFGLSYILPILVAILSAAKGSLILIENPEAHIHPYGIAKLTELMAIAAENGVQLIIETHSDHIINGLLVAVKKQHIQSDNIQIYYFDRNETGQETTITAVPIRQDGKIKNPPVGFFDQIRKDRNLLIGF